MALAITNHVAPAGDATNAASYTIGAAAYDAADVYYLSVGNRIGGGAAPNVPSPSLTGLTFTQLATVVMTAGTNRIRTTKFRVTGSAASAGIVLDFAGQSQQSCRWHVVKVTGHNTTTPDRNVVSNSGTDAAPTVTMGAFADAVNNAVLMSVGWQSSTITHTEEAGHTLLGPTAAVETASLVGQYKVGEDTTPSGTLSGTIDSWQVIAIEVQASGGAPLVTTPARSVGRAYAAGDAQLVAGIAPSFARSWASGLATVSGAATPPAAPTGLGAVVIDASEVELPWTDNATDETSYHVESRDATAAGAFAEITDPALAANSVSYSDLSGFILGHVYEWRVRARNAAGYSGYSNVVTATPNPSVGSTASIRRRRRQVWR